jgi:hypothetical protein
MSMVLDPPEAGAAAAAAVGAADGAPVISSAIITPLKYPSQGIKAFRRFGAAPRIQILRSVKDGQADCSKTIKIGATDILLSYSR